MGMKKFNRFAEGLEDGMQNFSGIRVKRFRHKRTGEIKTQIPIMELKDYEEIHE